MRYRVRHTTTYEYADSVDIASHMLHLSPRVLAAQSVLSSGMTIDPRGGRRRDGVDYFGNPVSWLFLDAPHDRFTVTAEAVVDVAFPAPPARSMAWEELAAAALSAEAQAPREGRAGEFTFPSPMLARDAGARDYAASSFPPGRPVLDGLLDLNGRIRQDFAFRPGVTGISTSVATVMRQRAGVCQDFTHLMIAGLRGLGLAARYVSGYLRTRPPPGKAPRRGADQSHAWVEAWLGPGQGWIGLDPTNALVVRDEHVVLAWGRDYGDISPVRGVILGGGKHAVSVSVDLEPWEVL
ncbi:MAG: transglutaminase family protein [Rhodospirillales bacterium]|nr:transglutaminase family protein [Rhodospirillales bacterium]